MPTRSDTLASPMFTMFANSLVASTVIASGAFRIGGVVSIIVTFSVAEVASDSISSGATIVGVVVSTTVIFCDAIAEFPDTSVAVHVTIVSPSGKADDALLVIDKIPVISLALASPMKIVLLDELVASTVISDGAVMIGFVVSLIVTV